MPQPTDVIPSPGTPGRKIFKDEMLRRVRHDAGQFPECGEPSSPQASFASYRPVIENVKRVDVYDET